MAGDLYEHRAHFVHELVQNADDAAYATSDGARPRCGALVLCCVEPSSRFTKTTSSLCVTLTSPPNVGRGDDWLGAPASRPSSPWPTPSMSVERLSVRLRHARDGAIGLSPRWLDDGTACRAPRWTATRRRHGRRVGAQRRRGCQGCQARLRTARRRRGPAHFIIRAPPEKLGPRRRRRARAGERRRAYRVFRRGDAVVAFGQPTPGPRALPICALPRPSAFR